MHALAQRLFPICRSITGNGVRETLKILQSYVPVEIKEIASGTQVFDWTIPAEWNIKEAWIKNAEGEKIVDFKEHNLHILNYSVPFEGTLDLDQLKEHLFTIPDEPDLIPYRTSYYARNWGFCLTHRQYESLKEGRYEVFIDSTLKPGSMTYGELLIPGETAEEFIFSTHICHPSLANDNLSGISLLTYLAKHLIPNKNHFSYRFLFLPVTIGSIAWLSQNETHLSKIKGGIVTSLVGDQAAFHYKKSRIGTSTLDQIAEYVLENSGYPYQILEFSPYGYDERQYCSPGINLPVGNLTRSTYGYREYHTSADNLDFISAVELQKSFEIYRLLVEHWEYNQKYLNLFPKGEPQLGRRGLYTAIGGQTDSHESQMAMLWILNLADGNHTILDMARKSLIPMSRLHEIAQLLVAKGLITLVH